MSFLNYRDMKHMEHKISEVPNHNIAENDFLFFLKLLIYDSILEHNLDMTG